MGATVSGFRGAVQLMDDVPGAAAAAGWWEWLRRLGAGPGGLGAPVLP
jgi:hypothetical protein